MSQIKIYGLQSTLDGRRAAVSDAIHGALIEHPSLPVEKRFQRFLATETEDFLFPEGRGESSLILEISMFEGRAIDTKKALIRGLFARLGAPIIAEQDVQITIFETPRCNWGIRGLSGDEIGPSYAVKV